MYLSFMREKSLLMKILSVNKYMDWVGSSIVKSFFPLLTILQLIKTSLLLLVKLLNQFLTTSFKCQLSRIQVISSEGT